MEPFPYVKQQSGQRDQVSLISAYHCQGEQVSFSFLRIIVKVNKSLSHFFISHTFKIMAQLSINVCTVVAARNF